MSIARLGITLASTFAALTFGLMNRPAAAMSPTAAVARSSAPIAAHAQNQSSTRVWSYQVDTSTLDEYLNTWAAEQGSVQTPLGSARLRQLHTEIRDNQLIVGGTADSGMFSVPVDATAVAAAQNGSVQVHIVQARINGMDMPDAARSQVEQQLQNQLAQSLATYGVTVQSVQLANGTLVIDGTRS
jgi:hypothetical protein